MPSSLGSYMMGKKKDGHMGGEVDKWHARVMTNMFSVVLTAEFR